MIRFIRDFLHLETSSGIVLMAAAALALLVANSPLAPQYETLTGSFLSHVINDGLMVIFFLVIGIEIKREMIEGELSTTAQAVLPGVAALGGVLLPALIYGWFNWGQDTMRGWAIPSATDIAFSLGVLALFGNRIPHSLKTFLMAVAVMDDLAAVLIIGLFYTETLSVPMLVAATACASLLLAMKRRKVERLLPFLLLGVIMWGATLMSGIHATVAGVVLGLLLPKRHGETVMKKCHGLVAFGIVPLFAFANAGVPLAGLALEQVTSPVTSGIALGLFFGKQLGIFIAAWLLIRLGLARLPSDTGWAAFYAVCMIAGIGFTMSLFIGSLAFQTVELQLYTRLGVLMGSLASALLGALLLALVTRKKGDAT